MKILIFSPYYPPHIGGLESHADEFNKHMGSEVESIVIFTPQIPNWAPQIENQSNNIQIVRFPAFEIIPNYPIPCFWKIDFWRLFSRLFKNDYSLVISRTRFFNTSILALFYAKIKNVPWIHIEHGSDFVKMNSFCKSFLAKIYDLIFGRLVLLLSDINIANSQASSDFCKKLSWGKKCHIIYRGVEIGRIENTQADKTITEKYRDKIKICYIGRLIDGKGVIDLIEAIKDSDQQCIALIIGDGPQKTTLEEMTRKYNLIDKILFFGHRENKEAISILKSSDIFVNPSYTEGLPTSVIEAALCKKAIIATEVGGTSEIITDQKSGILIKPKDITSLKQNLEKLINNPSIRERMGEDAYNEVIDRFNWNNSIKQYQEIFSKMITTKK